MTIGNTRVSTRGDIRLGSFPYGDVGVLAFNFYPAFGGDAVINSTYMIPEVMLASTNSYRYLRNTMAHEHGHGLGARHTVPCDQSKLMEPFLSTAFETVQVDDRRGADFNYGDRFSGNHTAANAKDFGNLTTPALRSVIQRSLSTNGAAGPNNTDEDWFRFSIGSSQPIVITAAPTGGTYTAGEQSFDCSGTTGTINASQAGNLNLQLIASNGTTVLQSAASAGAGATESLNAGTLAAGTYFARVFDVGPNAGANQIVQLYDLTIRAGAAKAPPEAIAGINKRIAANTACYFMGDANSSANEGALTNPDAYDWDLDGDGTFEVNDSPQPNRQYPSNGVYPVRLRVTDTNGMAATDTIMVTVFGASTSVASCTPSTGMTGASVPVTITGANLKNVTSSSMVTVSGAGVSVLGTPVPNALGTSISGLLFQVSAGAPGGMRNITVSNADGTGIGASLFNVSASPPAAPGPFNLSSPANGTILDNAWPVMSWSAAAGATTYNVKVDDNPLFLSPEFNSTSGFTSAVVAPGVLNYKAIYYWKVTAMNMHGSTASTPASFTFRTGACEGDANYDRAVNFADITKVLEFWGAAFAAGQSGEGDANDDDAVNFADITKVLEFWGAECF